MKWTSWLALAVLVLVCGYVVVTSLEIGGVRCEVCLTFEGRSACRAVDASTEEEARAAARTNACALLASGVTQTLACERSPSARYRCETR